MKAMTSRICHICHGGLNSSAGVYMSQPQHVSHLLLLMRRLNCAETNVTRQMFLPSAAP